MATYQETKPLATDKLSSSQADIQQNFQAIKDLIDINHETFNSGADPEGKHIKVDFTNSLTHPAVDATDVLLYNFANVRTAQQELYVKRTGALATEGVPFTAASFTSPGWSYLPSGLLIKWGSGITNNIGLTTITLPVGPTIPAFAEALHLTVSTAYVNAGADGDSFVRSNGIVAPWTQFTVWGSARTTVAKKAVAFTYFIIGI